MAFWLTSSTSPDSGAITSETAFTDSTSPYDVSFVTVAPASGGSKWTSSPSASAANHVMPSTASSPSTRAQSCSAWYLRSSGYDSTAANSALPLVDRSLDDACLAQLAADVDRGPRVRRSVRRRHVAHADADVEQRRLEAQRVACTEAARHDAAGEHRVPERDGVVGHAEDLAAVLAGVAGAVDHRLDS